MNDQIFEAVVSTLDPQGTPHLTPMGVRYLAGDAPSVRLLPFKPSRTLDHILSRGTAVLNVLTNAYKYSPRGGDVTIELHTPTEAAGLCGVTIRDQGIGMTPEQLSRVGERFYRADKSGNIPGTGLGMAIVTGSLALMGGSLEIDSTLGEGTAVTMWFPLALHKEPQADTPTSDEVTTH